MFWRGRLPREARDGAAAGALFRRNGWQGTWVSNVLPYWHFHTRGHEVLACVSGRARIGFGGDTASRSMSKPAMPASFPQASAISGSTALAISGWPAAIRRGNRATSFRPGDLDDATIAREIAALALPETDPISGKADGVVAIWQSVRP